MATIGGNLFTRHQNNIIHVHKDSNDLLSVIIILGKNVHGGETVFYDGVNMNDIGKRSHVLKHSHGRCVVGAFDKSLHEGSIWTGHRTILYFINNSPLCTSCYNFYDKYITSYDRKKYIDDDGSGVFQNKSLEIHTIQNIKRLIQINIMF